MCKCTEIWGQSDIIVDSYMEYRTEKKFYMAKILDIQSFASKIPMLRKIGTFGYFIDILLEDVGKLFITRKKLEF